MSRMRSANGSGRHVGPPTTYMMVTRGGHPLVTWLGGTSDSRSRCQTVQHLGLEVENEVELPVAVRVFPVVVPEHESRVMSQMRSANGSGRHVGPPTT